MKNLIDFEKCVHVFGGTSSPGCSKKAANTLLRNFYVDGALIHEVTDSYKSAQKGNNYQYQERSVYFLMIYRSSSSKWDITEGDNKQIGNNSFAIMIKVE